MNARASGGDLSRGRRAVLLAMMAPPTLASAAESFAGGPAQLGAGQTRTTLDFQLPAEPNGSYLTVEFRLGTRLVRAALRAPDGRVIELTQRLRRLPAEQARQPERGDLFLLTDIIRDPRPGRWQLVLEHTASTTSHTVFWRTVQQPRFAANLSVVGGDTLRSYVDVDVLVDLTDYGLPALNAQAGTLRVTGPNGSSSSHPMRPSAEPGRFEARVPVRGSGLLEMSAEPRWWLASGREVSVRVSRRWPVEGGPASEQGSLQVRLDRDGRACLQAVTFSLPWQADAAGPYVLSVLLGAVRVTGSTEAERAGPALLTCVLRGSRLAGMGANLIHHADVVEVVRASGASDLLLRRSRMPLSEPFNPAEACR